MNKLIMIFMLGVGFCNYQLIANGRYGTIDSMLYAGALSIITFLGVNIYNIYERKKSSYLRIFLASIISAVLLFVVTMIYIKIECGIVKLFLDNTDIFQGGIILSLIGLLIALGLMVILPGISVVSLYFAITYTNEIVFDIEKKKRQEKINNLVGKLKSELLININPKDNKIIDRDKLCLYDDMLNYNIKEPNKIWFTNDEKEGMLKNILFSINKKVNFTKYSNGFIVEEIKDSIDEEIFNLNSNLNEFKNYISYYNSKKEEIHKAIVNRINYYNFEYNSAVIGRKGEEYVNSELSLYENFYNLEGIRLEIEDANSIKHSIENDNIIVCKYGVFVLEVKNYGLLGNYDIKIERDGRWVK